MKNNHGNNRKVRLVKPIKTRTKIYTYETIKKKIFQAIYPIVTPDKW